jgi:hypothetical protein
MDEPVTKEELIEGYLKLYTFAGVSAETTIGEIKKVALDNRINWKQ